jgi:hypothetical protein
VNIMRGLLDDTSGVVNGLLSPVFVVLSMSFRCHFIIVTVRCDVQWLSAYDVGFSDALRLGV